MPQSPFLVRGPRSVSVNTKIFKPGEELPSLNKDVANQLLKEGSIISKTDAEKIERARLQKEKEAADRLANGDPAKQSSQPSQPNQPLKPPSPWTLDAESLKGKPLDELNAMIAERDAQAPKMETAEEAVAFLSQDAETAKANS